ncbi:hypothetical protein TSAR_010347 [Trichomalopsis sarcophagae]|uniref:Uncharacterized protein n=1 Tax=Trichomalopsis sarcophagae TaxID=543379 RepID=A0A232EK90_9HYME|nr:hypothetical protein TSAR_010347 [Trichomalopsis sarcophagae]
MSRTRKKRRLLTEEESASRRCIRKPPYTWCTDLHHLHNKGLLTKEGQDASDLSTNHLEVIVSLEERRCYAYRRGACQTRRYATCKPPHWSNDLLIVTPMCQRGTAKKLEEIISLHRSVIKLTIRKVSGKEKPRSLVNSTVLRKKKIDHILFTEASSMPHLGNVVMTAYKIKYLSQVIAHDVKHGICKIELIPH